MSLTAEVQAIRSSVALAEERRRSVVRLAGENAEEVLDAVCPRQPFLHEGQVTETLFCNAEGDIVGDVLIARAEESLWLLIDGMSGPDVELYLKEHVPTGLTCDLESLESSHDLLSVHGPYAWEFLAETISPEVIGLPPHGCYFFGDLGCFRAGNVGEYAYQLLVPKADRSALTARFDALSSTFDLVHVGTAALDVCRLENFVFNLHAEGRRLRDPLTLQLSWRLSSSRAYPGATAHRARRAAGLTHRAVLVSSTRELVVGQALEFEAAPQGEVIAGAHSSVRGDFLGIARLAVDYADPGVAPLTVRDAEGGPIAVRVLSAPALDNRSVHTSPQRHTYRTRADDTFPPLHQRKTEQP